MLNRRLMPPLLSLSPVVALAALAGVIALVFLTACQTSRPPTVKFLPAGSDYASKPDFARVERLAPLTIAQRLELTPQNLAVLSQEEIDQVYARLTAGPVPDGPYDGTIIFAKGGGPERIGEVLGGLREVVVKVEIDEMRHLGETLWKGKVFYRDNMELRNMIADRRVVAEIFGVEVAVEVVAEGIVDDDRFAPAVEQALAAVELRREQQAHRLAAVVEGAHVCFLDPEEQGHRAAVRDHVAQLHRAGVEDLALPQRLAQPLQLIELDVHGEPAQAAQYLAETFGSASLGEEEGAVVGAVGHRPGGQPGVDLIDLFLAQDRQVLRRQLEALRHGERRQPLDAGEIGLAGVVAAGRQELDRRRPAGLARRQGDQRDHCSQRS
jgi:hypothetical protein